MSIYRGGQRTWLPHIGGDMPTVLVIALPALVLGCCIALAVAFS